MGGESRYQIKIPSNQINKIISYNYSSNSYSPGPSFAGSPITASTFSITPFNPYFVTGFSDAYA